MSDPYFFGYGSLVNTKTHDYPNPIPATLQGWRRVWRHTKLREVAYLSVERATGTQLEGLVAPVPDDDWATLDQREYAYWRETLDAGAFVSKTPDDANVQIYQTKTDQDAPPSIKHPILLSYLDVVVQGYLEVFGENGVERFFATTTGWDAPILNDRLQPSYPRHQILTPYEMGLVDAHLKALSTHVKNLHEPDMRRERF